MLFIFLLGEIPGWILMAKEWRFFTLWRLKRTFLGPKEVWNGYGGISTLLPVAYQENISFNLTKVALNDRIMKSYLNKIKCGDWTEKSAICIGNHMISSAMWNK